MHELTSTIGATKCSLYADLHGQLAGLFAAERNWLANSANLAAALYQTLPDLNWAGFYFMQDNELVLGPFQGKIACVRIPLGRGVCGTAAVRRETVIVADVHSFPGHIACDAASRSEIVIPLLGADSLIGVLDLDSPLPARFDGEDARGLENIAALLLSASNFTPWVGTETQPQGCESGWHKPPSRKGSGGSRAASTTST